MTELQAIDTVFARMRAKGDAPAMWWRGRAYSYAEMLEAVDAWDSRLRGDGVGSGTVCAVLGDYSPATCSMFFALMRARAILVPFTVAGSAEMAALSDIAGVERLYRFGPSDEAVIERFTPSGPNDLVASFRDRGMPGLIVFTSGSTGKPKGILHDCERVMRKFVAERRGWRTLLFLMMDHFGGFNTMLSAFAYGGVAICAPERTPEGVARTITDARVTLLPTTPTFLNLLLASGSYRAFDLSSVELITYGTEVMPDATLQRVRTIFPNAQVKQTYGLSELGVLRSKSESDDSVWVKIGGDGFEVRVKNDMLWVRSEANMVGYLNAPSPFDEEGWMCTGDHVEVRGEYMRILGRSSDMINVGGQKVFPAEVEEVLLRAPNVVEAAVFGVKHPLLGHVVHARVTTAGTEDPAELGVRLRRFCLDHMAKYKVPVRFVAAEGAQHSERFKKLRPNASV
jgi:acyl-CoA synthetase (AMP-forming)/AMP-acid ligase II